MRDPRDIQDVYYTVPATGVYTAGEGRGLIRRRYTAGARIPMAVAIQFGMPGAEEREPTPGGMAPEQRIVDLAAGWRYLEGLGLDTDAIEGFWLAFLGYVPPEIERPESTQVDPANSDAGEASADNVAGTGGVNSTDTPPVNSTDTLKSGRQSSDTNPEEGLRATDTGDLPPETDEDRAFVADLAAGLIKNANPS